MSHSSINTKSLIVGLGLASLLFAVADRAYEKHPHVPYEAWFNFYGFFALVASFALVAVCRALRRPLSRDEDFYDG